jgi:hypothetical protein
LIVLTCTRKPLCSQFFLSKGEIITFLLFIGFFSAASGQKAIPDNFCITKDEQRLMDHLNSLRKDYGKSTIEFSISLSYVAAIHVRDLAQHHPDTSVCNLSSWSDKGDWTPCCHNAYLPRQDCMWDKPKELTTYPYRGYELAGYFEGGLTADSAMKYWSVNKEALDMILTEGLYSKKNWITMGVSIYEEYISVWFGQRKDNAGYPKICENGDDGPLLLQDTEEEKEQLTYYLIIGSFRDSRDAREALKRYRKSGFEQAGIVTGDDLSRVYLGKYQNLKEVMFAKQQLPYTYREAWIFKK